LRHAHGTKRERNIVGTLDILKPNERKALVAAAAMLRGSFPVAELLLFGSRARGEGDEESDLDLLIVTSQPVDWRLRAAMVNALFEIELEHDVILSPLVVANTEWKAGDGPLWPIRDRIVRDGMAV
jgi:predicted nucleotidyltransferase